MWEIVYISLNEFILDNKEHESLSDMDRKKAVTCLDTAQWGNFLCSSVILKHIFWKEKFNIVKSFAIFFLSCTYFKKYFSPIVYSLAYSLGTSLTADYHDRAYILKDISWIFVRF